MVEEIGKEEFDKADQLPDLPKPINPESKEAISDEEFQKMLTLMENPVEAQKQIAVQIKHFLDHRMAEEMQEKGILSDHTRRWVESYDSILDKIQKTLFGDKQVHLHFGKVSHTHVAAKVREAKKVVDVDNNR